MVPSHHHEDLSGILDDVVNIAGSVMTGTTKGIRSTRLRGRHEPRGTGLEPDSGFYVGERARGYFSARGEGRAVLETYVERTAPDLVVEVEITDADAGKAERYGELGVRELWRLHSIGESWEVRAELLALSAGNAPRQIDASEVLEGLTPADVCEAVENVGASPTRDEQTEAVERIVRRRQASVRVRGAAVAKPPRHGGVRRGAC